MIIDTRHLASMAASALRAQALADAAKERHASATDKMDAATILEQIATTVPGDPMTDHTVFVALDAWIKAFNKDHGK